MIRPQRCLGDFRALAATLSHGGVLSHEGYPQLSSSRHDHDLVLKPTF